MKHLDYPAWITVVMLIGLILCYAGCAPSPEERKGVCVYVDPAKTNGNNTGADTANACLTLADALTEERAPGDTIYMRALISTIHDSPAEICAERGHVWSSVGSVTLLYAPPRLVDLEDRTVRIYQNPNTITYVCERCGKIITDPVQAAPDTVVIWKRGQEVER